MKKISIILIYVFLISMLLSACGESSKDAIIVAGSTSIQPYAEMLSEEYSKLNSEIEVDVQGGGSSAGIMAVQSGIAHLGMSSRALKDDELDLWTIEIAKDGLAIIIHPDNPISDLSIDQVRSIYSGEIKDWGDLSEADGEIYVITREEGSGTRSAFEEAVMGGKDISSKAIVQNSNGAVRMLVSENKHFIGYISLGLVDIKGQKAVNALGLDGVAPTWDNVLNGSYSLYRPFLFVSKRKPEEPSQKFIDFILSAEGQQILVNEGLIPSAEGFYNEEF